MVSLRKSPLASAARIGRQRGVLAACVAVQRLREIVSPVLCATTGVCASQRVFLITPSGEPGINSGTTAFNFIGGGAVGDSAFAVVALGTTAYGIFMYINAWHYSSIQHRNRSTAPGTPARRSA